MYVSSEVLHQPRKTESRRRKERKDEKNNKKEQDKYKER